MSHVRPAIRSILIATALAAAVVPGWGGGAAVRAAGSGGDWRTGAQTAGCSPIFVRETSPWARQSDAADMMPLDVFVLDPHALIVGGPGFYSPYYTFRRRVTLDFGLSVGYAVPYPLTETPYLFVRPGTRAVTPRTAPCLARRASRARVEARCDRPGGLSFVTTPANASVYVDGIYVGTANWLGPTEEPVGVSPGLHHVELRAAGFQTMAFDADVEAGEVVPYRATLRG